MGVIKGPDIPDKEARENVKKNLPKNIAILIGIIAFLVGLIYLVRNF